MFYVNFLVEKVYVAVQQALGKKAGEKPGMNISNYEHKTMFIDVGIEIMFEGPVSMLLHTRNAHQAISKMCTLK